MKRNQKNQTPHAVYVVEGEGDSAFWTKIGAAWLHQDGKGFNIQLSCVPLNFSACAEVEAAGYVICQP
jgi:hypothetical protein